MFCDEEVTVPGYGGKANLAAVIHPGTNSLRSAINRVWLTCDSRCTCGAGEQAAAGARVCAEDVGQFLYRSDFL